MTTWNILCILCYRISITMPYHAITHETARKKCCAACGKGGQGRGGSKMDSITPTIESLIQEYAHPSYNVQVWSFPLGIFSYCRRQLFLQKGQKSRGEEVAEPLSIWKDFHLEDIYVPRGVAAKDCPCPICRYGKFNPVGMTGEKTVTHNPSIQVTGGLMECEIQPKVENVCHNGICVICLQLTGWGIQHNCKKSDTRMDSR